jgi:transposase-like protein
VHLVRASLRYAAKGHWSQITKHLRKVYTAPTVDAAEARFADFEAAWGDRYPAIIRLWRSAWEQFIPFLAFVNPLKVWRRCYATSALSWAVEALRACAI